MIRAALVFFVLALIAIIFGANGFAGVSMEIGKFLLVVFLVMAAISFIAAILTGKNQSRLP